MKEVNDLLKETKFLTTQYLYKGKKRKFSSKIERYILVESKCFSNARRNATAATIFETVTGLKYNGVGLQTQMRMDGYLFKPQSKTLKIVEIDSNRADQVAKKFMSRLALMLAINEKDKSVKFEYAIICYKGSGHNSHPELLKYFQMIKKLGKGILPGRLKISTYSFPDETYNVSDFKKL